MNRVYDEFAKGEWEHRGDTVVAKDYPRDKSVLNDDAWNYYGGELICESVRSQADGTLIAAAPTLLAACKTLVYICESVTDLAPDEIQLIDNAKATIDKAEGRTP